MNLQICTTCGEDLLLRGVSTFLVDNDTIRVLFNDGKQQNYPLQNVRWYGPEEPVFMPIPRPLAAKSSTRPSMDWEPSFSESDDAHEHTLLTQHHQDQYSD